MSSFGQYFRVTTFGESHCKGVGCIVDGVPPRMPLTGMYEWYLSKSDLTRHRWCLPSAWLESSIACATLQRGVPALLLCEQACSAWIACERITSTHESGFRWRRENRNLKSRRGRHPAAAVAEKTRAEQDDHRRMCSTQAAMRCGLRDTPTPLSYFL